MKSTVIRRMCRGLHAYVKTLSHSPLVAGATIKSLEALPPTTEPNRFTLPS